MSETWEVIAEIYGELQAELLRGLLEAQGIEVVLNQEGAGRAYGLNVGPLGQVQIMVPASSVDDARHVLADYYAGKFETPNEEQSEDIEENEDEQDN
ncbi:MAG: hypothetical protein A2Z45_09660 [Chloroflexi bacterium RBG_19FT_COMBO_55_16]|nr:MAG: hypothetical protein A2Z45_09660 [Chloroflexi bacterium RBG_19FT_COMBO_55_16]